MFHLVADSDVNCPTATPRLGATIGSLSGTRVWKMLLRLDGRGSTFRRYVGLKQWKQGRLGQHFWWVCTEIHSELYTDLASFALCQPWINSMCLWALARAGGIIIALCARFTGKFSATVTDLLIYQGSFGFVRDNTILVIKELTKKWIRHDPQTYRHWSRRKNKAEKKLMLHVNGIAFILSSSQYIHIESIYHIWYINILYIWYFI